MRQTMMVVQSKHILPVAHSTKPLVTSGLHKTLAHMIGNDFAFKAKHNGTVVDINEEHGLMTVKYDIKKDKDSSVTGKESEYDVINLNTTQAKNSGGG
jgi:hypothetical protein